MICAIQCISVQINREDQFSRNCRSWALVEARRTKRQIEVFLVFRGESV